MLEQSVKVIQKKFKLLKTSSKVFSTTKIQTTKNYIKIKKNNYKII